MTAVGASRAPSISWDHYRAVLFDLDGVLTPTADVHRRAWAEMFDEFLARVGGQPPFSDDDYVQFVDGKQRLDGVRSFLASRQIELPDDVPATPGGDTVVSLGDAKNAMFHRLLAEQGIEAYPGSVRLLDALAERAILFAVVSSSRNATEILAAAGLADRFPVVVDGVVAGDEGLAGKPAPDTFVVAAERLGVGVTEAVVVEDAVSGVAAGRSGEFGLVIGVDRGAGRDALMTAGADLVVDDLGLLVPSAAAASIVRTDGRS